MEFSNLNSTYRLHHFKKFRLNFNSLTSHIRVVFNLIFKSLSNDRCLELHLLEFLYNWILYIFLLVIFSFIIFISEELETSILEILFETCFITIVLFYIPDVFIFGYSFLLNKLNYFINLILNSVLPFVELVSYFLKSLILSVRLNTNFISGHLLLTVIFLFLEFFVKLKVSLLASLLLTLLTLFYILEIFVCVLQIYVILCLSILITHESAF